MPTQILSLKGVEYGGVTKLLNVQTQDGEITILPGHQPIISVLKKESRIYLNDDKGERHEYHVKGGFLHLDGNNNLQILVD